MITILGYTGPWWVWALAAAGVLVLLAVVIREARRAVRRRWPRLELDAQWCDDCQMYCAEADGYPCHCCADELAAELHNELEAERQADEADEQWTAELERINADRRAGELAELSLEHSGPRRLIVDLSNDPDLIEWDARQQAARVWEIAHVGFPALRAALADEYAAAAAELADFWRVAA